MRFKIILRLSFPLAALIIIVSCVGLFTPGFYSAETLNWQVQSIGQDIVDLVIATPCLLITSVLSYKNNKAATMIWGGIVLYLTYTFTLYCFEVHFNRLFVIYCLCLGLAFYSFCYFLFAHCKENTKKHFAKKPVSRVVGIYFIILAVLFYLLWLAEIIPSVIENTIPKSVADAGLFTNGVQVIDLSIILPAIFITGIFLLKGLPVGFVMAPVFLSFFILMDITIAVLTVLMRLKEVQDDLALAVIMVVLALASLILLIWFLRNTKPVSDK